MRALCDRYQAFLGIDECHATGFVGAFGRGTHEHLGLLGCIDIITGTFGKALGGASGEFTAARRDMVAVLRQRSRPYLFSNSLMPAIVGGTLAALNLVEAGAELRARLWQNTSWFRRAICKAGFVVKGDLHPIVPIMVGDAVVAQTLAARLVDSGVYVVAFSFPVVPRGEARIRVQITAIHELAQLQAAVDAFTAAGREIGLLRS